MNTLIQKQLKFNSINLNYSFCCFPINFILLWLNLHLDYQRKLPSSLMNSCVTFSPGLEVVCFVQKGPVVQAKFCFDEVV